MFIVCCLVWFGFGWLVVVGCACCVSCLICLLGCGLGVADGVVLVLRLVGCFAWF